jgi:hypothetical protein
MQSRRSALIFFCQYQRVSIKISGYKEISPRTQSLEGIAKLKRNGRHGFTLIKSYFLSFSFKKIENFG